MKYRGVLVCHTQAHDPSHITNLDVIPSHILLSNTDVELTVAKDHREARLKRELEPIKGNYEYIFVEEIVKRARSQSYRKLISREQEKVSKDIGGILVPNAFQVPNEIIDDGC